MIRAGAPVVLDAGVFDSVSTPLVRLRVDDVLSVTDLLDGSNEIEGALGSPWKRVQPHRSSLMRSAAFNA